MTLDVDTYMVEQKAWEAFRAAKDRNDEAGARAIWAGIEAAKQAKKDAEDLVRLRKENAGLRATADTLGKAEASAVRNAEALAAAEAKIATLSAQLRELHQEPEA